MPVEVKVIKPPQNNTEATTLATPPSPRWNEDKESYYEEQAAQEEYEQKIRDDYKGEMTQEILEEHGEDYTVWVSTNSPDIQEQIANVARSLSALVKTISTDNQLPTQPHIMTEPERHQLIALLKAMIAELGAPFIDRGRAKGFGQWLLGLGKKAVEKKATEAVQGALDQAGGAVVDLADQLSQSEGTESLTSINI